VIPGLNDHEIPAILAALLGSTHLHNPVAAALIVFVVFIVLNEYCSKLLYPRLIGAALGLHEAVVLFVLFAGLEVGGVVGVLFAAPITALSIVTIVHLYRYWLSLPDHPLTQPIRKPSASENPPPVISDNS